MDLGWQFYVSIAIPFLTLLVLAYKAGRRFQRLDNGLDATRKQANGQLTLMGTIIRILHQRKALDDQEFREVLQSYSSIVATETASLFPDELRRGNPLTPVEVNRLNSYVQRAQAGNFFNPDEVTDYNNLVGRMHQDRPNDPNVWLLVALGAFLIGLFIGAASQR